MRLTHRRISESPTIITHRSARCHAGSGAGRGPRQRAARLAPMGAAESAEGRWGLSLPWWSLAIGVLTTAFLVGLAFALLVMPALTYGFTSVAGLGSVDEPDVDRYELALAVGIGTNVFGALGLSRLALRTRAAAWPRVLTALLIAVVTGALATAGMLAVLGIDPLL